MSNHRIDLSQIYNICNQFKPDLVFLQAKPKIYCPNFYLLPKNKDIFSDIKYLKQLLITPEVIRSQILT